MKKLSMLVITVLMAVMTSCTAMPPEAVQLSSSLGTMITKARAAHVNTIDRHYDQLAASIDKFALNEYKQAFLNNLKKLAKQKDPNFVDLTPSQYDAALTRIMAIRLEWRHILDVDREQVLRSLEDYYILMDKVNIEITNILRSAAGVDSAKSMLVKDLTSRFGQQAKELEDKLLGSNSRIETVLNDALKKVFGTQ